MWISATEERREPAKAFPEPSSGTVQAMNVVRFSSQGMLNCSFLLGSRAEQNCGRLGSYCSVCQGCSETTNRCGMSIPHIPDHDRTLTWCHVVFAGLQITGTSTVVLLQCCCCCFWRALQLLNKSFPSPHVACLPVIFLLNASAWNRRIIALPTSNTPIAALQIERF